MTTIIKKAYYNPLIVFLLTIGYGLLKIDFGDTEGRATYGWLYILIVMWLFVLLYIVAYIRVLVYLVKNKQKSTRNLFNLLRVFLIINLVSLFFSPFEIMFGLYAITTYSGLAFIISLLGMAISGYLFDNEKNIRYFNDSKFVSLLIPLALVLVPVFTWWSIDRINEEGQKQEYKQVLEKGYQSKGKDYKIKMGQQYTLDKESVRVEFSLKDGNYEIPSGAELRKNSRGTYDIEQSTYVTLNQDYTKLATIQVNSESGQNVLKNYVNEVRASLKRIKVSDEFFIQNESKASSTYKQPHFSMIYLNWRQEAPSELKKMIAQAKKSNKMEQREFDGWVSLKVSDLMKTGLLIPEITVDYDWGSVSETNDLDWDKVNFLRHEVEEKLLSSIDYTQLIDGNYILSGSDDYLLKVRSGKLVERGEIPSRSMIRKRDDNEFSSSSDYTKWE
ncbi:polysaccharide biosynthesis protein [Enterococcus faecalis]|uniref:hypothetical protein n=1 Tax=Enterococcus faecalis TaxID=1351 RepID=UPI00205E18DD|nr:hypothetical protein [Enterococcus faecalis]BDH63973.1 hypothetical protein MTP05_01580 [Enterococcus sp. PLM3]